MTQKEKAEAYDRAIKVAADIKAGTATYITDGTPVIDAIFPELKESEDERIRKELIKLLRNLFNNYSYFIKDPFYTECIAWLEKQNGQKLIWSEEDEEILQGIWDEILANKHEAKEYDWKTYDKFLNWLGTLKYRYTWKPTEEQMKTLKEACDEHWEPDGLHPLYTLYQDLKKLRG